MSTAAFKSFVCWDPERAREVMDPEALQTPSHVFLATHHPIRMYLQDLTLAQSRQEYDEERFLQDFLAPKDFAFVPVIGESGTGKSHLIRWLAAKIEDTPRRKVLLIPRAGTNLRDIIGRILDVMEGGGADEYRARLNEAAGSISEEEARGQLLNNLATLIEYQGGSAELDDAEGYVATSLPALLLDWHFRQHLLKEGGIIDQLVTHIMGRRDTIEVVEERRRFTEESLPRDVLDIQKAGAHAQEFYASLINFPEVREAAVRMLNRHLDEAIARMLKLNREDLERLLHDVRMTLAEQDVELVLLIEDFAKLQGIDRQVLASVLERPEEAGRAERFCALRTALACTKGYFDSLIGTVKTRTTFSVTLDVGEIGENALVNRAELHSFVSRYLNAARLPDDDLRDWFRVQDEGGVPASDTVPSRCDACPHRGPCHSAFGSSHGMGLYPFTPKALERMVERATRGSFNPRLIIKDVLKHVLENYSGHLSEGQFPPPALQAHFGGSRIGAHLRNQIAARDPANRERREVLIDLWTDGTQLVDLDPAIHEAFDLPPAGAEVIIHPPGPPEPHPPRPEPPVGDLPAGLAAALDQLDRWANGIELPQNVASELRPLVYRAVRERVEWDAEFLLRNSFVGESAGIFLQRNVNFDNASTFTPPTRGVGLLLPVDKSQLNDAALALQALLKFKHHGTWKYPGGSGDFRVYARQLEAWSGSVVEQIRSRPRTSGEFWDPVPALTELLALGVRMAGHPAQADYTLTDLFDALFSPVESVDVTGRSPKWGELFEAFRGKQKQLADLLITYVPCAKGKATGAQVIDAVQLLDPLKAIRKSWRPGCDVPDDLRVDLKVIRAVREKVDQLIEEAVREERERVLSWKQFVTSELGDGAGRAEVVAALRGAVDEAKKFGDFAGVNREELDLAIGKFERAHFDRCMSAVGRIESETDAGRLLEELSRFPQATMNTTTDFILKANAFLQASAARVESQLNDLREKGAGELEDVQQQIRDGLAELQSLVSGIQEVGA